MLIFHITSYTWHTLFISKILVGFRVYYSGFRESKRVKGPKTLAVFDDEEDAKKKNLFGGFITSR